MYNTENTDRKLIFPSNSTPPKVSVIVPVYNVEKYVERAIVSLMEQSLDDVQYIIIDDGSKDSSLAIIRQVIARYPMRQDQVTLISRENRGVSATRAQGMEMATGDYVIHLDSDDWAELNWLETMYKKAIEDSADIVVCNYHSICSNKRVYMSMPPEKSGLLCLKQLLRNEQQGFTWNKLIRRDVILKVEEPFIKELGFLEDFLYILRCFYFSRSISFVERPLYNYNQLNVNSITKSIGSSRKRDIMAVICYINDFLNEKKISNECKVDFNLFKIGMKKIIIASEWQCVKVNTWMMFPETESFVLKSTVPVYFKISLLLARFNWYKLASINIRSVVNLKLLIKSIYLGRGLK